MGGRVENSNVTEAGILNPLIQAPRIYGPQYLWIRKTGSEKDIVHCWPNPY